MFSAILPNEKKVSDRTPLKNNDNTCSSTIVSKAIVLPEEKNDAEVFCSVVKQSGGHPPLNLQDCLFTANKGSGDQDLNPSDDESACSAASSKNSESERWPDHEMKTCRRGWALSDRRSFRSRAMLGNVANSNASLDMNTLSSSSSSRNKHATSMRRGSSSRSIFSSRSSLPSLATIHMDSMQMGSIDSFDVLPTFIGEDADSVCNDSKETTAYLPSLKTINQASSNGSDISSTVDELEEFDVAVSIHGCHVKTVDHFQVPDMRRAGVIVDSLSPPTFSSPHSSKELMRWQTTPESNDQSPSFVVRRGYDSTPSAAGPTVPFPEPASTIDVRFKSSSTDTVGESRRMVRSTYQSKDAPPVVARRS